MGAQVLARAPRNQRVNERGTPEERQDMHVLRMNVPYARVNQSELILGSGFSEAARAASVSKTADGERPACLCVGLFEQPPPTLGV